MVPNWMQPEYYSSDPSINNEIVNSKTNYSGKGITKDNAFISWCAPTSAACQLGHLNYYYTAPLNTPSIISDGFDAGVEIPKATTASTITWDICGNGWGDYLLDGPSQRGIVSSTPPSPIVTDIGFYMNTNNVGINGVSANSPNGTMITNIYKGLDGFYQAFGWTNMVGMCYHKGTPVTIGQTPAGIAPADSGSTLNAIKNDISNNRTVLGCFRYWNLLSVSTITVSTTNTSTETEIGYYNFGLSIANNTDTGETYTLTETTNDNSIESELGHTVCIIGYIDQNTSGDISGNTDWLIVRDNQSTTHRNVVIPYDFSQLLATVYVNRDLATPTTVSAPSGSSAWTNNVPDDPNFGDQWHLKNTGQSGGTADVDINVTPLWNMVDDSNQYIRGTGINVAVIDDGVNYNLVDLSSNYVTSLSLAWDQFNNTNTDAIPTGSNSHGTSCACIIGAKGNNKDSGIGDQTVGVAPNCNIVGINIFPNGNDTIQAAALSRNPKQIDIYNNSWGPPDVGNFLGATGPLVQAALQDGCTNGREGKGSIYVWAAGNGLMTNDNSNKDAYANSIYTIAVTAIDHNGVQSWYAEPGANILVAAPSNGKDINGDVVGGIVTGSNNSSLNYLTDSFGGTSAATPMVSGVIALMLQANPNLTYRDVMTILLQTARKNDADDDGWSTNSSPDFHYIPDTEDPPNYIYTDTSGYHISHKYGFGLVDALGAVRLAQKWETDNKYLGSTIDLSGSINPRVTISDNTSRTIIISGNLKIEQVTVTVDITHGNRGDLKIVLTSPSGTSSTLVDVNSYDKGDNYKDWIFSTVRNWGEYNGNGEWKLTVSDKTSGNEGTWHTATVTVYGTQP